MKTSIKAIKVIFNHLVSAGAKATTGINGGIYWLLRPKDSTKEDIVIMPLAMNGEELQEGVFNVNIHVSNLPLTNDDTQPDFTRFEAISSKLIPILNDVWGTDYNFKIEEPATPIPDGKNWFCNIRVRYWTLRNNN